MSETVEPAKNKGGRPVGARNKSSLMRAQLLIDDFSEEGVKRLIALAKNDKEYLQISDDVPCTIILGSIKVLMDKSVANEKDKIAPAAKGQGAAVETTAKKPKVFATAKS